MPGGGEGKQYMPITHSTYIYLNKYNWPIVSEILLLQQYLTPVSKSANCAIHSNTYQCRYSYSHVIYIRNTNTISIQYNVEDHGISVASGFSSTHYWQEIPERHKQNHP